MYTSSDVPSSTRSGDATFSLGALLGRAAAGGECDEAATAKAARERELKNVALCTRTSGSSCACRLCWFLRIMRMSCVGAFTH